MPLLKLPIPDTSDSIIRPVSTSILSKLMESIDIEPEKQRILFLDESGHYRQHGTTIGHEDDLNKDGVRFTAKEEIEIEIEDEYIRDDAANQLTVHNYEYPAFFRDNDLGVSMHTIYRTCEVVMRIKKRFRNKTHGIKWRDTMAFKAVEFGDIIDHTLNYHYMIPIEFLVIAKEIHRLRENVKGYGDEFKDWFQKCSTVRLNILSNLAGKQKVLGINEQQHRVLGYFDWDIAPEKGEYDENNATWTISFEYRFQFQRPTHIYMAYPQIIHNQSLAYPYIPKIEEMRYDHETNYKVQVSSLSTMLMEPWSSKKNKLNFNERYGVTIPPDDEWMVPSRVPLTLRLYQCLVLFNEEDEGNTEIPLFRIDGLEGYEFKDTISQHLFVEAPFMNKPFESVYQIQIYNQKSMLDASHIRVDPFDLFALATFAVNLRNTYHIRFSVFYDWTKLSQSAIDRLKGYPLAVKDLLAHIGIDPASVGVDFDKDKLSDEDMNKIIDRTDTGSGVGGDMGSADARFDPNKTKRFFTSTIFSVEAYRDKQEFIRNRRTKWGERQLREYTEQQRNKQFYPLKSVNPSQQSKSVISNTDSET